MAGLIACPACATLMIPGDRRCPSCDGILGRGVFARSAGAMVFAGAMLAGCPADDGTETMGDEGTMTAPTAGTTMEPGTDSQSSVDSTGVPTGPLYGVAETGGTSNGATGDTESSSSSGSAADSGSDSDSGTGSGTDGTTSLDPTGTGPSPLYGVAET